MMNTSKVMSAFLAACALGAAVFPGETAKAACATTEGTISTQPNVGVPGTTTCTTNFRTTTLLYTAGFTTLQNGTGYAANQVTNFYPGLSNTDGFYDGVILYCANEGWVDSHWQGPFFSVTPGGGNFPPSAYVLCGRSGDIPLEAEAYVWVN